ncbi:MAG: hypothetical protein DRJ52_01665 [Thermoprotei archaeon]|nr:MAG: hypothetical protein DRJ52_01665 [Thermoprotei archaeon]RLF00343.1 MAG: hypothetical protein DRJ63_02630 [Thermoprotei archaeon]
MRRVRPPVVAGTFYESFPTLLKKQIEECFLHKLGVGRLPSEPQFTADTTQLLISPHAGYMYSGPVASHGFYRLSQRGLVNTVIIIGPNHYGLGSAVAVSDEDAWRTPFGEVELDSEVIEDLVNFTEFLEKDSIAHSHEHSLEVQLPFLQYIYPTHKFSIVPIVMRLQTPEVAEDLANGIYRIIEKYGQKRFAVIASSDFTHYEPYENALRKDLKAINLIKELKVEEFYNYIIEMNVTICGVGPIMALMVLASKLNKRKVTLLKYATSGDITGDKSAVVGYASIIFE